MRSFKLSLIVNICILTIIMWGCSEENNPVAGKLEPSIEGNSYYNPVLNFKISAPEGWKLSKDKETAGYKLLLLGEQTNYSDYQSTFNIVSEHAGSRVDISGFLPATKEYLTNTFFDVVFNSEKIITLGGLECGELVFQSRQGGLIFRQRQLYFWSNESIVVITFNTTVSKYLQLSADFDLIQNSLETIR